MTVPDNQGNLPSSENELTQKTLSRPSIQETVGLATAGATCLATGAGLRSTSTVIGNSLMIVGVLLLAAVLVISIHNVERQQLLGWMRNIKQAQFASRPSRTAILVTGVVVLVLLQGLQIYLTASPVQNLPTGVPPTHQYGADFESCDDEGRPHVSSPLTYAPGAPTTFTEVSFNVTISNMGCGAFSPEILAIAGVDPNHGISDIVQIRSIDLAPGESYTLRSSAVFDLPGTYEVFVVYSTPSGEWHMITDTSGESSSIYIIVDAAGQWLCFSAASLHRLDDHVSFWRCS